MCHQRSKSPVNLASHSHNYEKNSARGSGGWLHYETRNAWRSDCFKFPSVITMKHQPNMKQQKKYPRRTEFKSYAGLPNWESWNVEKWRKQRYQRKLSVKDDQKSVDHILYTAFNICWLHQSPSSVQNSADFLSHPIVLGLWCKKVQNIIFKARLELQVANQFPEGVLYAIGKGLG